MLKSKKAEVIAELTGSFADTAAVVICDYKGLTVIKLEKLRKTARDKNTSVKVVKNTLATIALKNVDLEGIEIKDTNIFVWGEDSVATSKVVSDFAKKNELFVIKSAYIDREAADAAKVEAFAKLPGREELLGMLAATWMAPLTCIGFGLNALKEKKENEAA